MKEVAHGIYKDHSGFTPPQRLLYALRPQCKIEPCFERMAERSAKALRKPLGVAIVAACTDLSAARDGVPRCVSPLDRC